MALKKHLQNSLINDLRYANLVNSGIQLNLTEQADVTSVVVPLGRNLGSKHQNALLASGDLWPHKYHFSGFPIIV